MGRSRETKVLRVVFLSHVSADVSLDSNEDLEDAQSELDIVFEEIAKGRGGKRYITGMRGIVTADV